MNALLDSAICLQLVITLGHFVWQGLAVGGLACLAGWALRRCSSSARYRLYLATLLVMTACPVATFLWLNHQPSMRHNGREHIIEAAILTDRMLEEFRDLPHLRTLRLVNTSVSGRGVEAIGVHQALEELDVSIVDLPPDAARAIGRLTRLRKIRTTADGVTDETLAASAGLVHLEELELWAGNVTDAGVRQLARLKSLRKLALRSVRMLQWRLFMALQRQPLDEGQQARLAEQNAWFRDYIQSLPKPPEGHVRGHAEALADFQAKIDDPLSPMFKEPLIDERFDRCQEVIRKQAQDHGDIAVVFIVFHVLNAALQARFADSEIPVPRLETFDERPYAFGAANRIALMFPSSSAFAGLNSSFSPFGSQFLSLAPQPTMPSASIGFSGKTPEELDEWFREQEQRGHLTFDKEAKQWIGLLGTRLASIPQRYFFEADQIPVGQLVEQVQKEGSRLWKLPEPVSRDSFGTERYNNMAAVLTPEGRLFLLKVHEQSLSGLHFHVRQHHPQPVGVNEVNNREEDGKWLLVPGQTAKHRILSDESDLSTFGIGLMLLEHDEVREELSLSSRTMMRVAELRQQLQQELSEAFDKRDEAVTGGAAPGILDRFLREANEGKRAELQKLLTDGQAGRLRQLVLQFLGIRALHDEDVAVVLGLTADQRTQLAELQAQFERRLTPIVEKMMTEQFDGEADWRREFRRHALSLYAEYVPRYRKVLTEAQREQFRRMQGKPLTFPDRPPQLED